MEKSNIDYSTLVDAVQKDDQDTIRIIIDDMRPRLVMYLVVRMKADEYNAEECVQQSFVDVLQRIRDGYIKDENMIYVYLIKAVKHEYLKFLKKDQKMASDEVHLKTMAEPAAQYISLMDKERQRILKECMEQLKDRNRKLIQYYFTDPEASDLGASSRFKLSHANVRTLKSRIVNRLHQCYQDKSVK